MHDSDELVNDESMPEDDMRSVSGFKDVDSNGIQGNDVSHSDHTFLDYNASAERLSLPDHLDYICEEVSSLHSKLDTMESFIIHQVSDGIKSSLPALITTALQVQLLGLLSDMLRDCLSSIGMQTQLINIQSLFESAMIINDTAEVEKNKKAKDLSLATTQGEPQLDESLVKEEKKSKEIISLEDDSDEDDKQPLSKIFKITTLIPNPTPMNTFVPEHLPKPKEQQKSIQEFIDQLFKTTSLRFSPTPPRELTPPRDSSKGQAVATIEEPGNELV
nr:hypothetical protein [Tanacetum cinerariifolium]